MIKQLKDYEVKVYDYMSTGDEGTKYKTLENFSVFQVDSRDDIKELCKSIKHLDHPVYYNGMLTTILEQTGETRLANDLIVVKSEDYK